MQFAFTVPTDPAFSVRSNFVVSVLFVLSSPVSLWIYLRLLRSLMFTHRAVFVLTEKPHQVFSRCGFQVLFDSDGWSLYPPAIFRGFLDDQRNPQFIPAGSPGLHAAPHLLGQKKLPSVQQIPQPKDQRHPVVPPGLVQKEHLRSPALFHPLLYPR